MAGDISARRAMPGSGGERCDEEAESVATKRSGQGGHCIATYLPVSSRTCHDRLADGRENALDVPCTDVLTGDAQGETVWTGCRGCCWGGAVAVPTNF